MNSASGISVTGEGMKAARIINCGFWIILATLVLLPGIAARAATGWGVSPIFTLDTRTLAAPSGLSASKGTYYDKVTLTWNTAAGASGYQVWRHTSDSSSAATQVTNSTSTNCSDYSASAGQAYYYWIKATNGGSTSAFSSSDTGWRTTISAGICADFDGDRKADPAIYDESTGTWKIKLSGSGYYMIVTTLNGLGGPGYASVAADYDGDRKADPAVYHEVTGRWIILPSSANYAVAIILSQTLGGSGYSGMPADYDGDLLADPGVYHRDNGDWRVMLSTANYYTVEVMALLGGTGYRAVAADYDGDAKADPAVYGESTGYWIFKISSANYFSIALAQALGGAGYIPVPADYDGDGLADPAVKSINGTEWIVMFSTGGYAPVTLAIGFE